MIENTPEKPSGQTDLDQNQVPQEEPEILGEVTIEELSIDGICGVY